jgi:hypothetical protein
MKTNGLKGSGKPWQLVTGKMMMNGPLNGKITIMALMPGQRTGPMGIVLQSICKTILSGSRLLLKL